MHLHHITLLCCLVAISGPFLTELIRFYKPGASLMLFKVADLGVSLA